MPGTVVEIEVKGLEELQRKLELEALMGNAMRKTIGKAVLTLEKEVKYAMPVDTGRLRASVTPEVSSDPIPLWGKVGTNVLYASYVEHGTKKMESRHVVKNSQARVKGQGPFSYGFEQAKSRIDELLKEAEDMIAKDWNK